MGVEVGVEVIADVLSAEIVALVGVTEAILVVGAIVVGLLVVGRGLPAHCFPSGRSKTRV